MELFGDVVLITSIIILLLFGRYIVILLHILLLLGLVFSYLSLIGDLQEYEYECECDEIFSL